MWSTELPHHFKASQGVVTQRPSIKNFVLFPEIVDDDVIVHHYGLVPLYIAQGGHVEDHAGHVVGVTPHLTYRVV